MSSRPLDPSTWTVLYVQPQHACELKCCGEVTLGRRHSTCPDAGSGTPLSPSQPSIPECALFTYLGPHTVLHHFSKFLWPPIRPANLSCVPCFPVPFVRVPGIQWLDCPAVPAILLSACRDRCFTSPPQIWAPCEQAEEHGVHIPEGAGTRLTRP